MEHRVAETLREAQALAEPDSEELTEDEAEAEEPEEGDCCADREARPEVDWDRVPD